MRSPSLTSKIARRLGFPAGLGDPLERDLLRLRQRPRFTSFSATLGGLALDVVDGASAAAQYEAIFHRECYAFPAASAAPAIIDCGANIGLALLYWKRRYPAARITAFEADPFVFQTLSRNCRTWKLTEVTLLNQALWSAPGTLAFAPNHADGGHISAAAAGGSTVEVESVTLSPYLAAPVDLLKIDIEGAELAVLEESAGHLDQVARLFVEYHSFIGQPQRLERLLEILAGAGFRYHIQSEMETAAPFQGVEVHNGKDMHLNIFAFRT